MKYFIKTSIYGKNIKVLHLLYATKYVIIKRAFLKPALKAVR